MARSTGKFISYDIRPAKQSERRILIDILRSAGDAGLPINQYRYVGMGANRFYDFLLVHRYLGISNMVSLEHDHRFFARAAYNVPYNFIEVLNLTAGAFCATDSATNSTIYWLDYDGGISSSMVSDISAYAMKLKLGDFFFVTVGGMSPRPVERLSGEQRVAWLQDNIGPAAGHVSIDDVQDSCFENAVYKILKTSFQNAFAPRRDGRFEFYLEVSYSDSMMMVTVGGAFLHPAQSAALWAKLTVSMPFLHRRKDSLYHIQSFHITEKERALLDKAVTASGKKRAEQNLLKQLGFKKDEIDSYRELLRFLPRYVESIV